MRAHTESSKRGTVGLRGLNWASITCLVALACGTDPAALPQTEEETSGESRQQPDSGTKPIPKHLCQIPTFEDDSEAKPFESLVATILDEDGEPIPDLLAQACGTNICLNAKTNASGRASISETTEIAKLAFKYGDGLHYAHVAILLDEEEQQHDLGELTTLRLPDGDSANGFSPGVSVTSSDATLLLQEDTEVSVDFLSYPDEEDHVFVARQFPDDALPKSIAELAFDAVWVFGPQKTKFCPPAKLTLPNTAGLPAGTKLELHLLVTGIEGEFAPYAEWGRVSAATVNSSGTAIETDDDSGLPELGVVGLRAIEP